MEIVARGEREWFSLALNVNIKVLLDFFQKIADSKGSAFGIRQSSLPLRSAPWLCATGTRRPFIKGGRKFYVRV